MCLMRKNINASNIAFPLFFGSSELEACPCPHIYLCPTPLSNSSNIAVGHFRASFSAGPYKSDLTNNTELLLVYYACLSG